MTRQFSHWRRPEGVWRWLALAALLLALLLLLLLAVTVALRQLQPPQTPPPAASGDSDAFLAAIAREPHVIDGYRNLSLAYLAAGQVEEAAAVWQRAAAANEGQTWPWLALGQTYADAGLLLQARAALYQAASLNPQDTAANQALAEVAAAVASHQAIKNFLAARLPERAPDHLLDTLHLLRQPLPNGWTFLGYHGDLAPLAAGEQAPLWLFWQAPAADVAPSLAGDAWQAVAPGLWALQVATANLVPNGNFEAALTRAGLPGFPTDLYAADPITRQARRVARGEGFSTAALLANDSANRNSSLVSDALAVPADSVLLAAVEVWDDGGNPRVSWSWPGALAALDWPLLAGTAGSRPGTAGAWQTYTGLAVPPPAAPLVQLELRNTDSTGSAWFDNAVLAALPLPAPLWPAGGTTAGLPPDAAETTGAPAVPQERRSARFAAQMNRYRLYPASAADPAWLAALAAIGPLVRIDQPLRSGWTLLGYSTDEAQLANGAPTPLALYWQGPPGARAGSAAGGWYDGDDGRWLQFLPEATTSLAGGGFEEGLASWPETVFPAPASTRQLAITDRNGYTTTVGALANSGAFTATSLVSAAQPAPPDQLFLQTGWLRNDGGLGWIGYQWGGDIPAAAQPPNRYIIAQDAGAEWRRFAGVAEPLPGATSVQVHLLNYPSAGVSYFDDIVFVPVPAPQPAVATIQLAGALALLAEYAANPAVVDDERWLAAVAATGPTHLLDQGVGDEWTFVGYSADAEALAAGAVAPVLYYWQGPPGATPGGAQEGWYSTDAGLWIQVERRSNLLPSALQLALPAPATSSAVAVDGQRLYLQSAQVHSTNGAPVKVGVTWQGNALAEEAAADGVTQYIARHITAAEGTHVAGVLAAPPGAGAAQVLLAGDGAQAEAGELLLLPVTAPAAAGTGS